MSSSRSPSGERERGRGEERAEERAEDNSGGAAESKSSSGFSDINLKCKDCDADFIFSIGEQEFYAQKGFDNKPARCQKCKEAKKDRMGDSRGGGRSGGGERSNACYAFQRGECNRGSACRFTHEGGGGGGGDRGRGGYDDRRRDDRSGGYGDRDRDRGGSSSWGDSRDSGRGGYERRDDRGYDRRDDRGGDRGGDRRDDRGGGGGRGGDRGVCYAFQKGNCDRGSSCRFSHN